MESGQDEEQQQQQQHMEEVRVLVPGTMGVSAEGSLVLREPLGLGSVLLLEEGNVEKVQILKHKMGKIKEEVFAGNEVGNPCRCVWSV